MRSLCTDRDRLRAEYDAALQEYTVTLEAKARIPHYGLFERESQTTLHAQAALAVLELRHVRLRNHCLEHGCDPESFPAGLSDVFTGKDPLQSAV